jgi:hypothetical protein
MRVLSRNAAGLISGTVRMLFGTTKFRRFVQSDGARHPRSWGRAQKETKMPNEIIDEQRRTFLGTSALVLTGAMLGVSAMTTSACYRSRLQAKSLYASL